MGPTISIAAETLMGPSTACHRQGLDGPNTAAETRMGPSTATVEYRMSPSTAIAAEA